MPAPAHHAARPQDTAAAQRSTAAGVAPSPQPPPPESRLDKPADAIPGVSELQAYAWLCNAMLIGIGLAQGQAPRPSSPLGWLAWAAWLALPLGLGLAYTRRQRMAARVLLWGGWLVGLRLIYEAGGLHSPVLLLLAVQIATAAWLQRARAALAVALLNTAYLFLLARFEHLGWRAESSWPATAQAVLGAGCLGLALCVALLSRRALLAQARRARATTRAWEAQDEELHKLSSLIEQCPIGIVITDPQRRIEYVNKAFIGQAGLPAAAFLNLPSELLSTQGLNARQRASLQEAMARGEFWRGEQTVLRPDGTRLVEEIEIGPIRRANGEISHWFELKKDITVRRWAADQIERLVYVDTLTQLPNQAALHDRLEQTPPGPEGRLSLLLLRLGALGLLNETRGSQAGDACLQQVAGLLRRHLPEAADGIYRIGGAEFAIVLPAGLAAAEVDACARRIYQALGPTAGPSGPGKAHCPRAQVLLGATVFPLDASDQAADGLRRARLALRQARHEAPGRPCWYQPRLGRPAQQRQRAREAFGHEHPGECVAVSLRARHGPEGEARGHWAELCWAAPTPDDAADPHSLRRQARSANLAFELDETLLARLSALLHAQALGPGAPALTLALLSPLLRQHDAVHWLEDCLDRYPLPREALTLALCPHDLAGVRDDEELLAQRLQALREAGFRLCLSGFGLGFPGVLELPRWPVDEVLLHPALLQSQQAGVPALLDALLQACEAQALQVVVEAELPEALARRHPGLIRQAPA